MVPRFFFLFVPFASYTTYIYVYKAAREWITD